MLLRGRKTAEVATARDLDHADHKSIAQPIAPELNNETTSKHAEGDITQPAALDFNNETKQQAELAQRHAEIQTLKDELALKENEARCSFEACSFFESLREEENSQKAMQIEAMQKELAVHKQFYPMLILMIILICITVMII